jgi:hypothetical protein
MTFAYVIILVVSLLLSPFASTRLANQIYMERAIPFLNTLAIIKYSKRIKNKVIKAFLNWLANFCDCYWCTSLISALFVMICMAWTPTRLAVILYGLSEVTILMNKYLHKE